MIAYDQPLTTIADPREFDLDLARIFATLDDLDLDLALARTFEIVADLPDEGWIAAA
jgi:hypothetical protein